MAYDRWSYIKGFACRQEWERSSAPSPICAVIYLNHPSLMLCLFALFILPFSSVRAVFELSSLTFSPSFSPCGTTFSMITFCRIACSLCPDTRRENLVPERSL